MSIHNIFKKLTKTKSKEVILVANLEQLMI
jgi:hypothetical protein